MEVQATGPMRRQTFNNNPRMLARLSAFVIWAAVAASAVFWLLRLIVEADPPPSHATPVGFTVAGTGDWSRLLGRPQPAVEVDDEDDSEPAPMASSRYRLVGVVAPRAAARPEGVALIAVDNGPAKAYRVGAVVDGTTVLQSVHGFGATLGPRGGAAEVRLDLPALPPPATGTLPAPGAAPALDGTARPGLPGARPPTLPMVRPPVVQQPPPPEETSDDAVESDQDSE
jgi:general secretion pathway protein C